MNVVPNSKPSDAIESAHASWEWIGFALLFLYILATRLWRLDIKPVQHDESMFAYYSFQILRQNGFGHMARDGYEFLPILHGPLLEWATALVFRLFRDSDATMRLFPAISGIGIAAAVWGMREELGQRAALMAVAFIALSPTLLYFSRFCRNDMPFLLMASLMILGFVRYARSRSPAWLAFAVVAGSFAICVKETWAIFFFILGAFVAAASIYAVIKRIPLAQAPVVGTLVDAVRRHSLILLGAAIWDALIIVSFYTSFFAFKSHWNGPLEGLRYWAGEHEKNRIGGPYHFYMIHLAIYELPFLVFWLMCLVSRLWRYGDGARLRPIEAARWSWLAASAAGFWLLKGVTLPERIGSVTHMSHGLHIWIAAELVVLVSVASWKHLNRGKTFRAFADVWTGASIVIFSYAGEKVPWVTAHIVLPLVISCALYADDIRGSLEVGSSSAGKFTWRATGRWLGPVAAATGLGWLLWLSLFVSFVNPGSPIERFSYASSHPQFYKAVNGLIDESLSGSMGFDTRIAFQGEVAWPLWWSLRHFQFKTPEIQPALYPTYIIIDQYVYDAQPEYLKHYDWVRVRFRHYWQPEPLDLKAMSRIDLLLRSPNSLDESGATMRERGRNDWLKLLKATFLRTEDIEGPTRWNELGGLDAYIGRIKPEDDPFEEPALPNSKSSQE